MSQPDLLTQLREARPMAPAELREHVRRIAADATPPARRRLTWRRALVVAIPAAAVVAGVAALSSQRSHPTYNAVPRHTPPPSKALALAPTSSTVGTANAENALPAPNPNRVQRISALLQLRVPNTQAVSDDTKQAVAIARALGGYARSLNVDAQGRSGYATIVLRVPRQNVQRAVARLSALGTIVGENVQIRDITAQVDATAKRITRLEQRLAYWQRQLQTSGVDKHIASIEAAIAKLRRGRASTIQAASFATLSLQLTTKAAPAPVHRGHGPLHGLAVAFRWIGIGAVYVLALGAPLLILTGLAWLVVRAVRRHRENELLGSS
jgi:Domain of unknown function (DUF4349)